MREKNQATHLSIQSSSDSTVALRSSLHRREENHATALLEVERHGCLAVVENDTFWERPENVSA